MCFYLSLLRLAGANSSWFHLFRMLLINDSSEDEAAAVSVATTVEQFLQTASLGEFEKRLDMISTFG